MHTGFDDNNNSLYSGVKVISKRVEVVKEDIYIHIIYIYIYIYHTHV